MKKTILPSAFSVAVLIVFLANAQPQNTPDILLPAASNSVHYNPSVYANPFNPEEAISGNVRYNYTELIGGNIVFSLQNAERAFSNDFGQNWNGNAFLDNASTHTPPQFAINEEGVIYSVYGHTDAGIYLAWSNGWFGPWQQRTLKARPNQTGYSVMNAHLWIDNSGRSLFKGNKYASWRFNAYEASNYIIEFTRSAAGSDDWSNPVNISANEPVPHFEAWPVLATGPFGEVYACWVNHSGGYNNPEFSIGFNSSFDGGKTFTGNIYAITNIKGLSGYANLVNLNLVSAPSMAVDISGGPYDGRIYIVWANVGVPGINTGPAVNIYMIASDDKGQTWTAPVQVNQDPPETTPEHFMPAITCDPETGTLTIIYYDNKNPSTSPHYNYINIWGSISYDGGDSFTGFQVNDVTMNRADLKTFDNFLSNKIGVSAANGRVYPVWADFRNNYCKTYTSPFDEKPVAKPDDLTAIISDANTGTVQLNWVMNNPAGVMHYNIYRNNQFITNTSNLNYQENLPENGRFVYRVAAQFAEMESAPETAFVNWGEGNLEPNHTELNVELSLGSQATYMLRLENSGTLPVDYSISVDHDPDAGSLKNSKSSFGYTWSDSNKPGGPGFNYIDISSSGTEVFGIQNNNFVGPFPMGFSFPFFENHYNEFFIASDGLITFGSGFNSPTNAPIPTADNNNNFIAWCWDDLQQKTGGQVFYQHFDNYTIIQFKDYAQDGPQFGALRYVINAQVILYKNGNVLIQYLNRSTLFNTLSCTIGIENSNGTDGVQVAFNQSYIEDNLAVMIFNPGVKWLNLDTNHGLVAAGGANLILAGFDALDLPVGEYFANINIVSNASGRSETVIPVKLEVKTSILAKPMNLDYNFSGNDLTLTWDAPQAKGLLGYNLYESGQKINNSIIVAQSYLIENLPYGNYYYQVTAVYDEGESIPEGNPLFVTNLITYQILAAPNDLAYGNVTGSGFYDHGTLVILTADPNSGYKLLNWTEGAAQVSTDMEYSFVADKVRIVQANFIEGITPEKFVQNTEIIDGEDKCYEAEFTIHVSGFTVYDGGIANFVAGHSIVFGAGTHIQSGAYMLARITEDNIFCLPLPELASFDPEENPVVQIPEKSGWLIYPNPTNGTVYIEPVFEDGLNEYELQIFNAQGKCISQKTVKGQAHEGFNLANLPKGMYLLRISSANDIAVKKIILQ